jgi:hypothetical protein
MWVVLAFAFCRHPGEGRDQQEKCALKRKKPQVSRFGKLQLRTSMKPQPINALGALRDGASCSDPLW